MCGSHARKYVSDLELGTPADAIAQLNALQISLLFIAVLVAVAQFAWENRHRVVVSRGPRQAPFDGFVAFEQPIVTQLRLEFELPLKPVVAALPTEPEALPLDDPALMQARVLELRAAVSLRERLAAEERAQHADSERRLSTLESTLVTTERSAQRAMQESSALAAEVALLRVEVARLQSASRRGADGGERNVELLVALGFVEADAREALARSQGDTERACVFFCYTLVC